MDSPLAQIHDQRFLSGPIQALLDHVDDQDSWRFGLQFNNEGNKSVRYLGSIFEKPSQSLIYS